MAATVSTPEGRLPNILAIAGRLPQKQAANLSSDGPPQAYEEVYIEKVLA